MAHLDALRQERHVFRYVDGVVGDALEVAGKIESRMRGQHTMGDLGIALERGLQTPVDLDSERLAICGMSITDFTTRSRIVTPRELSA